MISRRLKNDLIASLKRLRPDVNMRDVLVFGGIASAAYGINLIYPPAAWIFCGLALFWLGIR